MKHTYFLAVLATTAGLMTSETKATQDSPCSTKPLQFYAGLSAGVNHVKGKRSESVFVNPPVNATITFIDSLGFKDTDAQYAGFLGISYVVPTTSFFISPEIHLGRTHTQQTFQKIVFDPVVADQRTLKSTFSQTAFFGAVVKVGYNFSTYSPYIILGGEGGKFQDQVTYVPFAPDSPNFFKTQKWLKGFLWGIGIEKKIKRFRVGIEARFINYGKYNAVYDNAASDESIYHSFKPKNVRLSLRVSYAF